MSSFVDSHMVIARRHAFSEFFFLNQEKRGKKEKNQKNKKNKKKN
jgi:hypothetical protein